MTHYMELLASNQPWNLLIFMALPVVLAETVAITELYILYTRKFDTWVRQVNRIAGILVGLTFVGIIIYLMFNAVIPITQAGEWRTMIDMVAVATYLIGGVPMVLLALQDLGLIYKAESEERRLARHATYVAIFLVFAHIAMIAGMMDPGLLGYVNPAAGAEMHMNHESRPVDHSQH
jgi:hypothetical protein